MADQLYDTPIIPGTRYCVHDINRPQPKVVTPGTFSTQEAPGTPPSDAVVLFNGKDTSGWVDGKGEPAAWKAEGGVLHVVPGTGDIQTVAQFGDIQLHIEFSAPSVVKGDSQGRGNSGVFLMGQYEVQVLDCYENQTYADGTVGGLYGQYPPLVNAARKPGEWSVYDILWTAPRFSNYKLVSPAYITVILNGIVLHNHAELQGPTQHRALAAYTPHSATGPLKLQDHGDLVRFRNIWYRPITGYDGLQQ